MRPAQRSRDPRLGVAGKAQTVGRTALPIACKVVCALLLALLLAACAGSIDSGPTPSGQPAPTRVSEPPAASSTPATAPTSGVPTPIADSEPSAVPFTPAATQPAQLDTPSAEQPPAPTPAPTAPLFAPPAFSYPIGMPDRPLGDGFFIRHGFATENTWYNPGYWHTGEDWYAVEGDTAGAQVYAVAEGEVVYADANYPGRVVIVRHADDLFSMYGHLDPALAVQQGQRVVRGQLLGTVLRRGDNVPNHLHFEIRTFLTKPEVNGDAPRYPFRCGVNCSPGPGYWPIDAPDLPSDLGWRNPTHTINRRAFAGREDIPLGEVVAATQPVSQSVTLWDAPPGAGAAPQSLGEVTLMPGARYALVAIDAGPEDSRETSGLAYRLWYRLVLPDERSGWVQAAVPAAFEKGSDGRPSSVRFNLLLTTLD